MNIRKFYNNVYDFRVHLVWPVAAPEFQKYVRRIANPHYRCRGTFVGICWHGDPGEVFDIIIGFRDWSGSDRDLATLVHEVAHAAQSVLTDRGVRYGNATSEAYAYLQESIFLRSRQALSK